MIADLPPDWADAIGPLPAHLTAFLAARQAAGRVIYPPAEQRFAALRHTPLAAVKAVILGQDPYHGPGQANGFSFSVPPGIRRPPSLRNIFKEMAADLGLPEPDHGNLLAWADQGVLLLNSVLTVEQGQPASHAKRGWEGVTARILQAVNNRPGHVAFVLWGAAAQKIGGFIDRSRHLVIASAHPSPLSARTGFFGSRPFSRINAFLAEHGVDPVDWRLD